MGYFFCLNLGPIIGLRTRSGIIVKTDAIKLGTPRIIKKITIIVTSIALPNI